MELWARVNARNAWATSEAQCGIAEGWRRIVLILFLVDCIAGVAAFFILLFFAHLTRLPGLTCWLRGQLVCLAALQRSKRITQHRREFLACHTFLTALSRRPLWATSDECRPVTGGTSTVRCPLMLYLEVVLISLTSSGSKVLLWSFRRARKPSGSTRKRGSLI